METGDGVRVKAAIAAYSVGTTHPSSIMIAPHRSANARSSLAFDREERSRAHGLERDEGNENNPIF